MAAKHKLIKLNLLHSGLHLLSPLTKICSFTDNPFRKDYWTIYPRLRGYNEQILQYYGPKHVHRHESWLFLIADTNISRFLLHRRVLLSSPFLSTSVISKISKDLKSKDVLLDGLYVNEDLFGSFDGKKRICEPTMLLYMCPPLNWITGQWISRSF